MYFDIVSYLISIMSVNVKQITSSNTSSRANVMCGYKLMFRPSVQLIFSGMFVALCLKLCLSKEISG